MNNDEDGGTFGQRSRMLLQQGVQQLDGATRARLSQARSAALAQRDTRSRFGLRLLAPAGALAAVVLATVLLIARDPAVAPVNGTAGGAFYDLELLADADAWELAQEPDLEFIEWAAAMGDTASGG